MTEEISEPHKSEQIVISKIYYIRGLKVMLDRDLAELYGVEPRRLREQVKRNEERFLHPKGYSSKTRAIGKEGDGT